MQDMTVEVDGHSISVYTGVTPNGTMQYTEAFQEYCFSLYAGEAGRSVARVMSTVEERHGIKIGVTTAHRWKKAGNWEARSRELYQVLRPGYINDTLDAIMVGAMDGSAVLADMAAGRIPTDMNRAKVIFGLMDRAGLMPHSAVAEHIRMKANERPTSDVSSYSNEELAELEASYQPNDPILPDADIPDAVLSLASAKRERR